MKTSKNLVVHLTTGYAFLTSIETPENDFESALEYAVKYAIKNDLNFSMIKDNEADDFIKDLRDYDESLLDMSDDEVLEYYNYLYLDLSSDFDYNVYVSMANTRIDNTIFDNTYTLEEVK